MKILNLTSDQNECRIFFQRQGWETHLIAQNMGIGLNKKYLFFHFGGSIRTPPNLGSARILENVSTLGLYCAVNKTLRNVLFVTIQEPLTRPFQNTPYFS